MNIYNHLCPLKYMITRAYVIHVCTWHPRANPHFLFASLLKGKMDEKNMGIGYLRGFVSWHRCQMPLESRKYACSLPDTESTSRKRNKSTCRAFCLHMPSTPLHEESWQVCLRQCGSQADLGRYSCKRNVRQCRLCGPGDRPQVRDARVTRRSFGRDREIHNF
ncbi:UNVERIFIED_CONTAM: hypothetical protein HHA_231996 [Hammondia hammondi]|eukprot:XP_008885656.1 hypothetical protein HHA_231996 [Hammondia hammondi]